MGGTHRVGVDGLLVTYRPEFRHQWTAKSYYSALHLEPIAGDGASAFLDALLGEDTSVEALGSRLIERCEGRPLFLEETVQSLAEQGVLAGEPGAWRLAGNLDAMEIPDTVQAVIAARIDRLAPEHKDLFHIAAVIGRTVPYDLLRAVAGLGPASIEPSIGALQAGEFLFERQSSPTRELIFKHALTESVAYASVLRSQREAMHAAIVRAIEERNPSRLQERLELLGHHAFEGRLWEKAAAYLRGAGNKATAAWANSDAIVFFERALDALGRLPETNDRILRAVDIRMEMRPALGALARYEEIRDRLREAADLARGAGDARRAALVSAGMTHVLNHTNEIDDRGVTLQGLAGKSTRTTR